MNSPNMKHPQATVGLISPDDPIEGITKHDILLFKIREKTQKTPICVAKITKTPLKNRHFISLSTYDNLYK